MSVIQTIKRYILLNLVNKCENYPLDQVIFVTMNFFPLLMAPLGVRQWKDEGCLESCSSSQIHSKLYCWLVGFTMANFLKTSNKQHGCYRIALAYTGFIANIVSLLFDTAVKMFEDLGDKVVLLFNLNACNYW
jgi:hypothetical protein